MARKPGRKTAAKTAKKAEAAAPAKTNRSSAGELTRLIKQLTIERQVMLEAKIVEVQLSEGFQSGINWANLEKGYGVGLDLTRRDLQAALKDKGRPWELGKAFDRSAPLSALVPAAAIGHPGQAAIWLTRNGTPRQQADIADMIWSVAEIIVHLSGFFRLEPGDLIFTGTPEGVGPVVAGDELAAGVEGVGRLRVRFV